MAQYSPDQMKWMRLIRVLEAAQRKLDFTEKLLNEPPEGSNEPEPIHRHSANEEEDDPFCQVFWEDMLANREKAGPARRYHAEIYAAAFILRTMSSRGY
jgi:hypothetical protein